MKISIIVGTGTTTLPAHAIVIVRSGMLDIALRDCLVALDANHAIYTGPSALPARAQDVCELLVADHEMPAVEDIRRWIQSSAVFAEQLSLQAAEDIRGIIERLTAVPAPFASDGASRVYAMQRGILAALDRPLNLREIAKGCGLSPFAASRLFHHATGLTMRTYTRRLRLRNAIVRMRTGQNLTQIAQDFGFCDLAHFSKAFKSDFGASPSEWRKALRSGTNAA
ncbi:MAG: helix-turn-helix domain-containing protein [Vulcanimicrobiaceae bacterium]